MSARIVVECDRCGDEAIAPQSAASTIAVHRRALRLYEGWTRDMDGQDHCYQCSVALRLEAINNHLATRSWQR